ncbi:STM3941 family protein [Oceanobacillus jeddahense]|uniref:Uncharacterized protein n=1 Tax=Oceanobacillus jeddahense TaxID=1462527 RepID=A0ABY5JTM5_9BACI|nr:STM3941 family protein [Oceanobacillus jeddahense]UUI02426.1 hypothetical protein NP439_20675 [Oceanobacillus jeddahense]
MSSKETLYFYQSMLKNVFLMLMGLIFTVFGITVAVAAFDLGDYGMSALGLGLTLFFGFFVFALLKLIFNRKPYIILTEETLTIGAFSKNAVPIQWEDVEGYDIRHVGFDKVIEIKLIDEEKYRARMSNISRRMNKMNEVMNYRLFGIALSQIKRKERNKFVHELDRLAFEADGSLLEHFGFTDTDIEEHSQFNPEPVRIQEQMHVDKKMEKIQSQVNGSYFLKAYGISLLLMGGAFLMFHWSDQGNYTSLLIVSFILYPYAKVIWDVLLGFRLSYKMDKDESSISMFFYRFMVFVHIFMFLFSIVLAPFGILYVIVKGVRSRRKESEYEKEQAPGQDTAVSGGNVAYSDNFIGSNDNDIEDESRKRTAPFYVRFSLFLVHICMMLLLIFLFTTIELTDFIIPLAILFYGVTFSVYVALYPGRRGYFLSLFAYLWRIAICFYALLLITGAITGETLDILTSLMFAFVLFLLSSYLFYKWGAGALRSTLYHFGNKSVI